MTTYSPGDEVKFLNEKGGGKIIRMIDSRMALVAIEDGFEIPVLLSDIMPVSRPGSAAKATPTAATFAESGKEDLKSDTRQSGLRRFAKNPEPEGIYLAFVPHEQQWILTGPMDVVLVNHSPAKMLYNLVLSADGGMFVSAGSGHIEPNSKLVVETIVREDINKWSKGLVNAILVQERSKEALQPAFAPFDIKASRFYKEGSYAMSGILGDKAIMISLAPLALLKICGELQQAMKTETVKTEPMKQIVKEKQLIDKHRTAMGEAVVDLHIGELIDNILGLSSRDMFNIQMDYFRKTLDNAMRNEYTKVTYIHGVGNGVLKNAIVDALADFGNVGQRMASMQKFGVGAIDVLIKETD